MNNIPLSLRKRISAKPYYKRCARAGFHGHECGGRITYEHALIHAGKQVQEEFAIVPLCAKAHGVDQYQDGGDFDKDINVWIALNRATDEELLALSKAVDYFRIRAHLNDRFGVYNQTVVRDRISNITGINYGAKHVYNFGENSDV